MELVSLQYDGGTASVYRNADGSWLGAGPAEDGGDSGSRCGTLLDALPACVGIGDGRTVVGGLLPPGASRAVIEGEPAVSGNGAWIAITNALDGGAAVAARYEAGDGTIVRPALPAGWAHEPLSDADEPCPACGAVTWERVTPTDGSRGMSRSNGGLMRPSAVVVCLRCGHEVPEGARAGPGRASFAFWRTLRDVRVRWRRHERPALAKLKFPVYALIGADAERAGHEWDREGVCSVTIRHDRVEITTRALRDAFLEPGDENRRALMSVIQAAEPFDWGPGSNAARALRIHTHRRAVAARVAGAESFAVELRLHGVPVRFAGLRDRAGWAAAGDTTEARIVLLVSGIEPDNVALHRL